MKARDLVQLGTGLRWLLLGHHGGLAQLPERLAYLRDLEAAHVAQGLELAQVAAAAEERLRALEAEQAARRSVERGAAFLMAQRDAMAAVAETARRQAEELQRRIHAAQAEGRKTPMPVDRSDFTGFNVIGPYGSYIECLCAVLAALEGRISL